MKNRPHFYLFAFFLFIANIAGAQRPPAQFFRAMDLMATDEDSAKHEFMSAVRANPLFYGSYHFLGAIYSDEKKWDSAQFFLQRALMLNEGNLKNTKELTYLRLIDSYLLNRDFGGAFENGWLALKQFPQDRRIASRLRDVCLWAVFVRHNNLDSLYINSEAQPEYLVNSVPQEYLILRTLRKNGEPLSMSGQSLVMKNGSAYDVLRCTVRSTNESLVLNFKLNWKMETEFSGQSFDAEKIYSDTRLPVYERIGARLADNSKADIKAEIEKLRN